MEIKTGALLRVVKATRMSVRMAKDLQALMVDKTRTWADEVSGLLADALFEISGEELTPEKSFNESVAMMMLKSDMSDASVADGIMLKNRIQNMHLKQDEVQQPKPQTISKEEFQRMYVQSGGYQYTPEGEFK